GRMKLDEARARVALAEAGQGLGLDVQGTAWGIHDIVNENMAAAARNHIAEKGLDARQFTLVATGGAGPVHAIDVARRLRIPRVLCPVASGIGSCLGFLAAPARSDRSWSKVEPLEAMDRVDFGARLAGAREAVAADLAECGLEPAAIQWRLSAEIRYSGQGNTVEVLLSAPTLAPPDNTAILELFEAEYSRLYHTTVPGGVPELVTWRVSGSSEATVRRFALATGAHLQLDEPARSGAVRNLYRVDTRSYEDVPVYERYALAPGTRLMAPLVLTEPESTLVVASLAEVRVLDSLTVQVNLELES
ncbi:MAG: hydantoinase/oxoprolinase family protein, partial [Gammaproteobacteria bacterium]